MGMYFQDDFFEACNTLSKKQREKLIAALVCYHFTGEEPQLTGGTQGIFISFRSRIDLAKKRAESGAKGGSQQSSKSKANHEAKAKQTTKQKSKQNGSRLLKSEKEKETYIDPPLPPLNDSDDAIQVIDHLNKRTGKSYKPTSKATLRVINARLNEGHSIDDLKHVIDVKTDKWGNDAKMRDYLRPQTLFAQSHFEDYLNEKPASGYTKGGDDDPFAAYRGIG